MTAGKEVKKKKNVSDLHCYASADLKVGVLNTPYITARAAQSEHSWDNNPNKSRDRTP